MCIASVSHVHHIINNKNTKHVIMRMQCTDSTNNPFSWASSWLCTLQCVFLLMNGLAKLLMVVANYHLPKVTLNKEQLNCIFQLLSSHTVLL